MRERGGSGNAARSGRGRPGWGQETGSKSSLKEVKCAKDKICFSSLP